MAKTLSRTGAVDMSSILIKDNDIDNVVSQPEFLSAFIRKTNFNNNKLVSSPIDKMHKAEVMLFKIFEEEINAKEPVLISYSASAIHKAAKFITGVTQRSASIGIAGETASGKSTVTLDVIDTIESFARRFKLKNVVTRVNTDDYYYDRSEEVKRAGGMAEFAKNYDFDIPEALELDLMCRHIQQLLAGNPVMLPKYDMSGTAKRVDEAISAFPSKVIISEGLFTLTDKIRDAFDFKIYVDIDRRTQKERFFVRAHERGLGSAAHLMYENASNKAEIYIRACKHGADIVLSGQAKRKNYKIFMNKILSVVECIHTSK